MIFPGLRFLHGVKGCPRCPLTIARASGVLAWLRVGGVGAAPHRVEHGKVWKKLLAWARGVGMEEAPELAQKIRNTHTHLGTATLEFDRRLGAMLYEAVWRAYFGLRSVTWFARRSLTRRWLPSDGCEWLRLQGITFSAAFHVLRLLAHGLLGLPGARTRRERQLLPWSCQQCHGPEIAWVSYTPTNGHPGAALCWGCAVQPVPPPGSAAWRLALPVTFGMSRTGRYPACPLCGWGEAGGEHLFLFCASVQQAWHDLTARSDTPVLALLQPVAPPYCHSVVAPSFLPALLVAQSAAPHAACRCEMARPRHTCQPQVSAPRGGWWRSRCRSEEPHGSMARASPRQRLPH